MARKRPTASGVQPPELTLIDGGRRTSAAPALTRAEAEALRRSAPLTHQQLRKHFQGVQGPKLRGI